MPAQVDVFLPLAEIPADVPAGDSGDAHQRCEEALHRLALQRAAQVAGVPAPAGGRIVRRALDARKGHPIGYQLRVEVLRAAEAPAPQPRPPDAAPRARPGLRVVVVGSGPAGTFAALRLSAAGAKVTIIEQGKQVQPRRRDLALLTRGTLVETSNYCFGEGGAGTYSDGKLYTRIKDREAVAQVLDTLVQHGADPQIAVESRPHIGSNRLPQILIHLRDALQSEGVTYLWEEQVVGLLRDGRGRLCGVACASGREVPGDAVVLAVGHSARGMYQVLHQSGVALQAKAFAVGARVEHRQPLIDQIQYGRAAGHPLLPAAFYQLSTQSNDRGVYSFCMCPGGWIVPSATEAGGLCVNGMSLKRRDSPFANSALVVTVEPRDFGFFDPRIDAASDPLAGVAFQREIERRAFRAGGESYHAVAQRLPSVLAPDKAAPDPLPSSYRPGVVGGDLRAIFPGFVLQALQGALRRFQGAMPGFLSGDAQLVGAETRTSAPLRVLRDAALMSPTLPGLYPCGEGAGYAGGIISAAVDGLRVADAILAQRA